MAQTYEERRAYARGYNAGTHGNWPNLAAIPDERYRALAQAAHELASRVDHFLAQMDFDDRKTEPMQIAIDAAIDAVNDEIMRARTAANTPSGTPATLGEQA